MSSSPDVNQPYCVNPLTVQDVSVLIGMLAVLEGAMTTGADSISVSFSKRLKDRFEQARLVAKDQDDRAFRQAVNDLNHRLRFAIAEYPERPTRFPVPS